MSARLAVSVIMPTFQRSSCLEETIRSILGQSLDAFELIIADDGSTDGTSDVVRSQTDERIAYIQSDHVGVPEIINLGLQVANADYVIILHDHDVYERNLLESLAALLDRHPSALYAFCGISVISATGDGHIRRFIHSYPELMSGAEFLRKELLPGLDCPVSGLTMVRRSALPRLYLDPRYGGCADVEWWLQLAAAGDVAYTPDELIHVRVRSDESVFSGAWAELCDNALRAKLSYLGCLPDSREQRAVFRTWQFAIFREGVAALVRAIEHDERTEAQAILGVFARWGPRPVGQLLEMLLDAPELLRLFVLLQLRVLWRRRQGIRSLAGGRS